LHGSSSPSFKRTVFNFGARSIMARTNNIWCPARGLKLTKWNSLSCHLLQLVNPGVFHDGCALWTPTHPQYGFWHGCSNICIQEPRPNYTEYSRIPTYSI
jgi:hypothetical protein